MLLQRQLFLKHLPGNAVRTIENVLSKLWPTAREAERQQNNLNKLNRACERSNQRIALD